MREVLAVVATGIFNTPRVSPNLKELSDEVLKENKFTTPVTLTAPLFSSSFFLRVAKTSGHHRQQKH